MVGPGLTDQFLYRTGGLKFVVEKSGRATFDYNEVPPYTTPPNGEGKSTTFKVSGNSVAKIDTYSSDHSVNSIYAADELNVVVEVWFDGEVSKGKLTHFWPFGVGGFKYSCNATRLTLGDFSFIRQ